MAGSFDIVTLRCLANIPGPRFLNGLTQGDHGVVLAGTDNDAGTRWRRGQNDAGSLWNLECLGEPPPGVNQGPILLSARGGAPPGVNQGHLLLSGARGGGVLIAPALQGPGGEPQIWRAKHHPDGGITLENVPLSSVGVGERVLDCRH